jgi:hypothetical protein
MSRALLAQTLGGFIPHATTLSINALHKAGFDLDSTGRKRHILWMEEHTRAAYDRCSQNVNIAIWNMHLDVDHDFQGILDSGLCEMGKGGGFRIVVFTGSGYLQNNGARGFENWCCSGNQEQQDNLISFSSY